MNKKKGVDFFGRHAMNPDNKIKIMIGLLSLGMLSLLSDHVLERIRRILYGRRVSMHLMIQESILTQLMSNRGH